LCNHSLKEDFRYIMKQKGGMLAKGRLLGLQFIALLEDDLYFEIAGHADQMATQIREACLAKGFGFLTHSTTNQQFPVLPNRAREQLAKDFAYSYWQNIDGERSAVRFCTSWATDLEDVKKLVAAIGNL
jgi:threonine aldolase